LATPHEATRPRPVRLAFVSSNRGWGGSEELWIATAASLAAAGHKVVVYKSGFSDAPPRARALEALSCRLVDLALARGAGRRVPILAAFASSKLAIAVEALVLLARLSLARRPDLVIVSQGGNHDGWPLVSVCRWLGLRYAIVAHKASDLYWPADRWRPSIRAAYAGAAWSFFVSEHNLRLTEAQIDAPLPNASVVRNPFNVAWERAQPWPSEANGLRLGCIARINVMEKGQDILLRVLASEKWRARRLSVTFVGEGEQRKGLEAMAARMDLDNVRFAGWCPDIAGFWSDHHALVLPSRAEGLPLVLVEAMLSGRVSIVTDVGGSGELLDEGLTGFIADGPSEKCIDAALERAWARRAEWPAIGAAAAASARSAIPQDPAAVLADRLLRLAGCGADAVERPPPAGRPRPLRPRRRRPLARMPAER
jgi:glycosyltransferase involved in cell wall biosynthesis